jgi:hypothetical protein
MQSNLSQRASTEKHNSPYFYYKGLGETTMPTIFWVEVIGEVWVMGIFAGRGA